VAEKLELKVPLGNYLNPVNWLRGLVRATVRPRPRIRMWEWIDKHVVIPEESGGPCTGRMRTSRVPIFRGLYDIIQQRHVHFFTFCASARIGKTLFTICVALYWIAERFGWAIWLDPTRSSASKFVRSELDEFLLQCKPVRELAIAPPPHPASRRFWTTLVKSFRGKFFRIIGSGAEADLHGFNAEFAAINEKDRCRRSIERDAASDDKIIARTKLFSATRLILENSTPGEGGELSPTWQSFLARSQRYCYLPCPHCSREYEHYCPHCACHEFEDGQCQNCGVSYVLPTWDEVEPGRSPLSYDPRLRGWQRVTFFTEKKLVPFEFTENGELKYFDKKTPRDRWREETTGQFKFSQFALYEERPRVDDPTKTEQVKCGYDIEALERGTTYECAHCKKEIEWTDLLWMEDRFWWVKHNPFAPIDKESAHAWSAYNPFEFWGLIGKEFVEAVASGDVSALIKFWNFTLGLPYVRAGVAIKEDDLDRAIARTPVRYVQGQLPLEPELLTITVDVQDYGMWWGIRAWGILWDHPDWPTWNALIDWGEAVSWTQILEYSGLTPLQSGKNREFVFRRKDGSERKYVVTAGLVDSGDGDKTKEVYEFCLANSEIFSPYKGGDQSKTRGNTTRLTPIMEDKLDLIWAWSDFFAANLYYDCIKEGATIAGPLLWWLCTNIDKHYREQLTDEFYGTVEGKKGFHSRRGLNHLGDVEKMQRVLAPTIEERLDQIRAERRAEIEAKETLKSETGG
jgi:hypothetical protein